MSSTVRSKRMISNISNLKSKDIKVGVILNKVGYFLKALKCLTYTQLSEIQFNKEHMIVYADQSSHFQARIVFPKEFFSSFLVTEKKDVQFVIDIRHIIDFTSTLYDNNNIKLKLFYYGDHKPVAFTFTEVTTNTISEPEKTNNGDDDDDGSDLQDFKPGTIYSEFFAKIKNPNDPFASDLDEDNDQVNSELVIDASEFYTLFMDLDKAIENLRVIITEKGLQIQSLGLIQLKTNIFVKNGDKSCIFFRFEHFKDSSFTYPFASFKAMFKAMQLASRISMKTFENGRIKFQMAILVKKELLPLYIEFSVTPSLDYDDE